MAPFITSTTWHNHNKWYVVTLVPGQFRVFTDIIGYSRASRVSRVRARFRVSVKLGTCSRVNVNDNVITDQGLKCPSSDVTVHPNK